LSFQDKIIFIVGNSRSGTTMMLRIFNNHPKLMVLNELHFFEQLWAPEDKGKAISKEQAVELGIEVNAHAASRLYDARSGFYEVYKRSKFINR
jgi:hypothetical protein